MRIGKTRRPTTQTTPDHPALFQIAVDQGGYFTSAQAHEVGFSTRLIAHHVGTGRFIALRPWGGVYRLRDFPENAHDVEWAALVTLGPDAVLSHETALRLHDLSDVAPRLVHVWVPYERRPRMRRSVPRGVRVHVARARIMQADVTLVNGLRVTTPLRTLIDTATGGTNPEQVALALAQALNRGWVTRTEVERAARARGPKVAERIRTLLLEAGR